jgi:hypothetical protein
MEKIVADAKAHTGTSLILFAISFVTYGAVKFDFSVLDAMHKTVSASEAIPTTWIDWEHVSGEPPVPKMGTDVDNIPIVLWLPQFLTDGAHVRRSFIFILYSF